MGGQWKGLDLTGLVNSPFVDRFWAKVDTSGDCWEWRAYRRVEGYGQFTVRKGYFVSAHTVSYALANGPIPAGMVICHRCDNPPCVRPMHLFLGTPSDNAKDMVAKGRQGERHPGTARANARLTEESVRAIRAVPTYRGVIKFLADQYGVSTHTIGAVRRGQKWKHVS
jgi:hypothetical protein